MPQCPRYDAVMTPILCGTDVTDTIALALKYALAAMSTTELNGDQWACVERIHASASDLDILLESTIDVDAISTALALGEASQRSCKQRRHPFPEAGRRRGCTRLFQIIHHEVALVSSHARPRFSAVTGLEHPLPTSFLHPSSAPHQPSIHPPCRSSPCGQ